MRRGLMVSPGNDAGADLIVTNQRRQIDWSVKVHVNGRNTKQAGWGVNTNRKEFGAGSHVYVFVDIEQDANGEDQPNFLVVSSVQVAKKIREGNWFSRKDRASAEGWELFGGPEPVSKDARWTGAEPARAGAQVDEANIAFEREVSLLSEFSLDELRRRLRTGSWPQPPNSVEVQVRRFERNPLVAALARKRAGYRCEVPECAHPTFKAEDGHVYMEVHHIEPLAEGGIDAPENVACVCPSHHREVHHGQLGCAIRADLARLRSAGCEDGDEAAAPRPEGLNDDIQLADG